jgi:membrane protease YdiL (CAAX protease family)
VRSLGLLALVASLLLVAAVVSPWVTWGLGALMTHRFTFDRVFNRVLEILLVVALPLAWHRLDLGDAAALGLRRRHWARELGRGARIGLGGIAVAVILCVLLGAFVPLLRYAPAKTLRKALLGAGAAVLIGVGEEVLFRGVLLRRLMRDGGRVAGVAVTTAIYAAVHAVGREGVHGPLQAWSGFERLGSLFHPLAAATAWPQLGGLALLGLVLAAARLRTGSLWVPVGIHAAWVAVFRIGRLLFYMRPLPVWLVGPGWPPLVGGAAGWLGVAVTALLLRRSLARTGALPGAG